MALDTYQDLIEAVPDYLERADLGARLPTFVRLAEQRLARRLDILENEVMTRLDLVAGRAPLPDDYGAWRLVSAAPGWPLEYLPPHLFIGLYGRSFGLSQSGQGDGYDDVAAGDGPFVGAGRPRAFTIIGSVPLDDVDADISIWANGLGNPFILTGPVSTGQITLVYRQGLPSLGADQTTNWLLKKAPDAYLYATLIEAEPFLRGEAGAADRIVMWRGFLDTALDDIATLDRSARWGRSRIRNTEATP